MWLRLWQPPGTVAAPKMPARIARPADGSAAEEPPAHPGQLEVLLRLGPVLVPPLDDAAVQLHLAAAPAHLAAHGGDGQQARRIRAQRLCTGRACVLAALALQPWISAMHAQVPTFGSTPFGRPGTGPPRPASFGCAGPCAPRRSTAGPPAGRLPRWRPRGARGAAASAGPARLRRCCRCPDPVPPAGAAAPRRTAAPAGCRSRLRAEGGHVRGAGSHRAARPAAPPVGAQPATSALPGRTLACNLAC